MWNQSSGKASVPTEVRCYVRLGVSLVVGVAWCGMHEEWRCSTAGVDAGVDAL